MILPDLSNKRPKVQQKFWRQRELITIENSMKPNFSRINQDFSSSVPAQSMQGQARRTSPIGFAANGSDNVVYSVQASAFRNKILSKQKGTLKNNITDTENYNHFDQKQQSPDYGLHKRSSTQQFNQQIKLKEIPSMKIGLKNSSIGSINSDSKEIRYSSDTSPRIVVEKKLALNKANFNSMQRIINNSITRSQKIMEDTVFVKRPEHNQTQQTPQHVKVSKVPQKFRDSMQLRTPQIKLGDSRQPRIPQKKLVEPISKRRDSILSKISLEVPPKILETQEDKFKPNIGFFQSRERKRTAQHDLEAQRFQAYQVRFAKKQADKALKLMEIVERKKRFEKSVKMITSNQNSHIKLLDEDMEIDDQMYSDSEASDYVKDFREIDLENEIVGRLDHSLVQKMKKFEKSPEKSKRVRKNTMAVQFHKIQKKKQQQDSMMIANIEREKTQLAIMKATAVIRDQLKLIYQFCRLDFPATKAQLNPDTVHSFIDDQEMQFLIQDMFIPQDILKAKWFDDKIHPGLKNPYIDERMYELIQRWKENYDTKYINLDKKIITNQLKQQSQIVKQLKFTEFGRNMTNDLFAELFTKEPMLVYHRQMNEHQEICLNLISKIIDGTLVLQDYTLDSGHFLSLAKAIEQTQKPEIHSIYLDNCGVDDHELSLLLKGLATTNLCKKFVYKKNEFHTESLQAIKPLLAFQQPHNLQELRLVNLRINKEVIWGLLDFMIEAKVQLRSLSLVQLGLKKISMNKIARFVDDSTTLEDLDLSWSDVIPHYFGPLLEVLSRNKTLRSLNLSWNLIIAKDQQNDEVINFNQTSAVDEYYQRRKEAIDAGTDQVVSEVDLVKNHTQAVIYSFSQFIRYNKKLQRLNLSNCGLNTEVLVGLVQSLRHAKSLICMHLTSNPGLNDEVENYYRQRLRVATKNEDLTVDIDLEEIENITKEELKKFPAKQREVLKHKLKFVKQWKVEEVSKYQKNRRLEPLLKGIDVNIRSDGRDMSISRYLGHKIDLPMMGQWQMETSGDPDACWNCDNWMYTLIFWNPTIGNFNQINSVSLDGKEKKEVIQKIRQHNNDSYKENEDVPLFFSNITDWKPKPFIHLLDFINSFEKQNIPYEDFEEEALYEAELKFEFNELEEVEDESKQSEIRMWIDSKVEEMVIEFKKGIIKRTPDIIKNILRYKRPHVLNLDQVVDGDFLDVYVLPIFLHPGSNEWIIRAQQDKSVAEHIQKYGRGSVKLLDYQINEDAEFQFYYNRSVVQIREERVPQFAKNLRRNSRLIEFQLDMSVFKDWHDENDLAFEHDMKHWKMKSIIKDPEEQEQIQAIFKKNFPKLKEIFIQTIAHFNDPPSIKKREFYIFCHEAGIMDTELHSGIVDTYFKATNFEKFDMTENDDNALNRYEFMEILVRLARGKFIDFHQTTSNLSFAVSKLINNHILQMEGKLVPWHRFRRELMYDLEVNNIMEVNLVSIRKLYFAIAYLTKWEKKRNLITHFGGAEPTIDQILCFMKDKVPDVTERKIVRSFYLSKMVVSLESDNSSREYTFMKWPEFIELIPRLAYFKYVDSEDEQNQGMILADKIRQVLYHLLPLINEEVIEPPEILAVSDSDDDY